ncbi:protein-O-mannosyltransferase-like protein [Isoptericola jiangsuensis]|uniref:Polyprenol-phosphate-mannose--protein mannosyltransferase n=1 Tax=Isoptericola jiangsuensis TaxID=548579 RepID=A0A2A9EYN5_9MICO|nr:phospholipid carrier-dependent glycosyltransferase [Isoptericola jiangsuensis]PFG44257.1 protein-O-mannosyltransferase-like protein [Isoptericola jiangsuensis]
MSAPDDDAPPSGDSAAGGPGDSTPTRQYPTRREVHGRTDTRGIPVVTGAIRAITGATPAVRSTRSARSAGSAASAPSSPAVGSASTPAGASPDHPAAATPSADTPGGTTTGTAAVVTADRAARPSAHALLVRLLGERRVAMDTSRRSQLVGWVGVVLVTLVAAVTRLWHLGTPGTLVFDETYYVKDAFTLGTTGFERAWPDDPNAAFEAGDVTSYLDQAAYVVHPPVGKWMIWLGMELGGGATNPFAWRLAGAVVGIAAVFLLVRIARRLFASSVMGVLAGFLLAIDGQAIVHSRTALLDQFLMFWVLVAFGCLVMDREQARRRLAERVSAILDAGGTVDRYGPRLGMRWWRLAAGVSLGLACGVKWSGLYFVAVFGLLTVLWDLTARRRAGIGRWAEDGLLVDAVPAFLQIVPVALVTYVATWWSWITTSGGYYRDWATNNPDARAWIPDWLESLWFYHQQMYSFHKGLDAEHAYAAHPLGWIVQWRPTSFYWQRAAAGEGTCPTDVQNGCATAVTALGNPLLWFLAAIAIVVTIALGIWLRDWRALAVLSGTVAGWLPWFAFADRTIFTFYSIVFTPWVVLTLVYPMVVALERSRWRQGKGGVLAVVGVIVAAITLVSVAFYPFWSALQVPYDYWHQVFRFQNWI